jgi:hypothetical protein
MDVLDDWVVIVRSLFELLSTNHLVDIPLMAFSLPFPGELGGY